MLSCSDTVIHAPPRLTFDTRLNLTAANRIFIIEPQWNPSVENQAIARAIRLRQEEKVLVTRYTVKATVEEVWQALIRHRAMLMKRSKCNHSRLRSERGPSSGL